MKVVLLFLRYLLSFHRILRCVTHLSPHCTSVTNKQTLNSVLLLWPKFLHVMLLETLARNWLQTRENLSCSVRNERLYPSIATSTKYLYIKSTTVYVPSSKLGLSHPLSRQRVCPSPRNRGGGASQAGEGLGESQFRRLEKSLALCLLCGNLLKGHGNSEK